MKLLLVFTVFLNLLIATTILTKKDIVDVKNFVILTKILEPSLGVDEFNSRFLKSGDDSLITYPYINSFKKMDTIYE